MKLLSMCLGTIALLFTIGSIEAAPGKVTWRSIDSDPAGKSCKPVIFDYPEGIAIDKAGNIYVVNDKGTNALEMITPDGGFRTLLDRNSPSLKSGNYFHLSVAIDQNNAVLLGSEARKTIERLQPDGTLTVVAGIAGQGGIVDGPVKTARLKKPWAMAVDRQGNVYVADSRTIRKVSVDGMVSTLAGNDRARPTTSTVHHAARHSVRPTGSS